MRDPIRTVVAGVASLRGDDPVLAPAVELAAALGAELHLVHAYDVPEALDTFPEPATSHGDARARHAGGVRAALEARVREVTADPRVHALAAPGSASDALLRAAADTGAHLVVVGATRHGPVERAFLGTTAERVVRGARAPVLVLRSPPRRPERVLLATDLSEVSAVAHERGLEVAAALAGGAEPELRALLVVAHPPPGDEAARAAAARELGLFLEERTPRGSAVEPRVRTGPAVHEIVAEAREWGADLLVLGTHGRTGLTGFLLGSVATGVLRRVPCSVLVIPARGPAPHPAEAVGAGGAAALP